MHYVAWQRYWGTFIALVGAWGFAEREIAGKMYFHHTIFPPPLQGLHHTFLSRFHNFLVEGFTILTDHLVATQKSDGNTVQPPANGDPKKLLINKKLLIENLPVWPLDHELARRRFHASSLVICSFPCYFLLILLLSLSFIHSSYYLQRRLVEAEADHARCHRLSE